MHKLAVCALLIPCILSAQNLPAVAITIAQDSIDVLEADPFSNNDVHGDFIVGDTFTYSNVELHYRGAYNLWGLIKDTVVQRNWKVKFSKEEMYRNRREWNFTYERHVRQKLAYDLMDMAGVPVASARHVVFHVNGERHGLYLEYEDPDSKDWLLDKFGDKSGDLFKAGYDIPNEQSYFGLLTDLGDNSSDYFMHYAKKTNNDDAEGEDYTSLIQFIKMINYSPQESFPDSLKKYFSIEPFLHYLVVSNFILHWDSYPTRPKNYWLYNNPSDGRWTFIPWDLDLTFRKKKTGDSILDVDLSVFYQLLKYEPFKGQPNEGSERPLVHRMMRYAEFVNGYLKTYREALDSYLDADFLLKRLDSLAALVEPETDTRDLKLLRNDVAATRTFITARYDYVKKQLDSLPDVAVRWPHHFTRTRAIPETMSLRFVAGGIAVTLTVPDTRQATVFLTDISGRCLTTVHARFPHQSVVGTIVCPVKQRACGVYVVTADVGTARFSKKMIIE